MTKRRGFTIAEVLITSVLASLIVGATGGLMVFASKRAQHAYSENAVTTQVLQLSTEMEKTISMAMNCETASSGGYSHMKCTMPAMSKDEDNDSMADDWEAVKISSAGTEKFGQGVRIWYYWSDAGTLGIYGSRPRLYRAYRNDDAVPGPADVDMRFSRLYAASGTRWNLVDAVTFSKSPATGLINYVITASKLIAQERSAGGTSGADTREFRLSRSVMCQGWRK